MTSAQKRALMKFYAAKTMLIPRYAEIRTDVARALFDGGFLAVARKDDLFRAGYAPLVITERGREAAVAPTAGK